MKPIPIREQSLRSQLRHRKKLYRYMCDGDDVRCGGDDVRCDGDDVRCDGDDVRCGGDKV